VSDGREFHAVRPVTADARSQNLVTVIGNVIYQQMNIVVIDEMMNIH